jgi:PKD domain
MQARCLGRIAWRIAHAVVKLSKNKVRTELFRYPMRLARIVASYAVVALIAATAITMNPALLRAQDAGGSIMGSDDNQGLSMNSAMPAEDNAMAAPMAKMRIRQPITGSMLAAPPYGIAPMKVGFFVNADDPEGIGLLTYSWNFGDGTVSSLPPELYIFHIYQNPGSYFCTLTVKTVDGRSHTFMQGVLVKPPTGG